MSPKFRPVKILPRLWQLLWSTTVLLTALGAQGGVVFKTLYSFGSLVDTNGTPLDGANPVASLVRGDDGNFYGTTQYGGTKNGGTVFTINGAGELASLYSFTGNDGWNPQAGLVQGSDGNFYGTTYSGGTNGAGTVFKISTNGVLTSLYSFNITNVGEGGFPAAGLVQASDGNFYGTTYRAPLGPGSFGTIFRISTNGAENNLFDFNGTLNIFFGVGPHAGLVQGSDGLLYGTTEVEGVYDGAVFGASTNGGVLGLHTFSGGSDGGHPLATLIQGRDGGFYGTTEVGGTNLNGGFGFGTVFRITPNGVLTTLHSFSGGNDGASPLAGLVQGVDGTIYGTTPSGGSSSNGTVFAVNTNGTGFETLYSFSGGGTNSAGVFTNNDGANPQAALVLSGNTLYGTTSTGGTNGLGSVFQLTIERQLTLTLSVTNVILSWPTYDTGYTLEFATNLVSPVDWQSTNVWESYPNSALSVINGRNVVTNPISGSQMFFRLATAQNFGTDVLALENAMKAAGALSYGHQACLAGGPYIHYDMFYLPVPTHVIELANANPALCIASISTTEGPAPGHGCYEQWEGLVGPQLAGSNVIVIFGTETGEVCNDSGPYQGF